MTTETPTREAPADDSSNAGDGAASGSLERHLGDVLDKRLSKLAKTAKGAQADADVDTVHDLRVASRRLRAFGETFRSVLRKKTHTRLERPLKRVTGAVGPVRDRDVQLELLAGRRQHAGSDAERAALEYLLERLSAERGERLLRGQKRLAKVELGRIERRVRRAEAEVLEHLGSAGDERAYAREVLETLIADAALAVPPEGAGEDAERLHRLRIDMKELRYALELFEPLFGERFERVYERATALQDTLGAHRDLLVLGELVESWRAELDQRGRETLAAGLAGVRDWLAAERRARYEAFCQDGFDAAFWRENIDEVLGVS